MRSVAKDLNTATGELHRSLWTIKTW